MLFDLT